MVLPLHFSFCLAPSYTNIVLNLRELSLVLRLGPSKCWIFFDTPRDSFVQVLIWPVLFSLPSLTTIFALLHSRPDPRPCTRCLWHRSSRVNPHASWAPLHGTVCSGVCLKYFLLTIESGAATVARVSHAPPSCTGIVLIFSRFSAPHPVGLNLVSPSALHGVGWHSSNVQHFVSAPSLILWKPSDGLCFDHSAPRPDE